MSQEWVLKYSPKKSSEIKGQNKAIEELKDFIVNYPKLKKAALVYGDIGSGKTSSVIAIAKELNLELMEMNASDFRNKEKINSIVGLASQQRSLFFKSKVILVDEIDGLSGRKDRGGLSALLPLIGKSSFPIILTANDPSGSKFSALRKKVKMIEFKQLSYVTIASQLKEICNKEGLEYDEHAINSIAVRSCGDMRAAITDLHTATAGTTKLICENLEGLFERRKEVTLIEGLKRILKTTDINIALAALDNVDEDVDQCILWIEQNLAKEYKKAEDLERAYDALSKADVFKGRIRRWQYWRFLVYVYFLIQAGVAIAKKQKYPGITTYDRPKRILKMWIANRKNDTKKKIAEKLSKNTHYSKKQSFNVVPFIQIISQGNKTLAKEISEELELDEKEKTWLIEKEILIK
jgi:replication factor C large subunit